MEPEVNGVERFLAEQPLDLIRKGKFHKVPLIVGVTKDEFGGVVVGENSICYRCRDEKTDEFTETAE